MQARELVVELRPRGDVGWDIRFLDARDRVLRERLGEREPLARLGLRPRLLQQAIVVEQEFSGRPGIELGHWLCRWLFGDADEQRALLVALDGPSVARWSPNVRSATFNLELRTSDPELLGQPWHLLSWEGERLLASGWSIRVAPPHTPPTRGELPWPPRVLALAPALAEGASDDVEAAAHLDVLRGALCRAGVPRASFVQVASVEELRAALQKNVSWDIFYYFGHGQVEGGVAGLQLADDWGSPEFFPMHDLAELLRKRPPRIVYLNTCSAGAGGWHGAGNLLCAPGNIVLTHLCPVRVGAAQGRAERFFHRLAHDGDDPVQSFLPRHNELASGGFAWMCGAIHSSARSWRLARPSAAVCGEPDARWALRLDRRPQRMMVLDRVNYNLMRPATPRRGAAFVAAAGPDNHLHDLGEQLFTFLRDDEQMRRHLLRLDVTVPPDDARSQEPWDEHMRAALGAGPSATLADAMTGFLRSRGVEDGHAVVWLDFGGWPRATSGRPIVRTTGWLRRCRHWTERHFSALPRLRVAYFIGLEVASGLRGKIQRALRSPKIREELNSSAFAYDVLVEPGAIEYDDIREFLRLNQALNLTDEDQRALAEAIHKTATREREGTGYRASVELLLRGREHGWEQLLRELGGADEDEDFYDV